MTKNADHMELIRSQLEKMGVELVEDGISAEDLFEAILQQAAAVGLAANGPKETARIFSELAARIDVTEH
ncbi:hypothetical protein [Pelagibacterium sp.]|uniref:hypothetical protein n=1 Tax=Pelagibacterium sp. TaxID=1967288 RepID=UPI003BABBB58